MGAYICAMFSRRKRMKVSPAHDENEIRCFVGNATEELAMVHCAVSHDNFVTIFDAFVQIRRYLFQVPSKMQRRHSSF